MRVLITGAKGQLGWELQRTVPGETQVTALDHAALDIVNAEAVTETVVQLSPDIIINAAAYTAVDKAEKEPERAFAVNARGAAHVARAAVTKKARVIHISTDFVFDGERSRPYRVNDPAKPLCVYGASKREGEQQVLRIAVGTSLVMRTSWVYSAHGHNFVKTMLRLMRERDRLRIVADQIGTPTWANGLARAIWLAAAKGLSGVDHWTDAGIASWYDFAVAIQEEALPLRLLDHEIAIEPVRSEDYPTSARRPAYSVLDNTATWQALSMTAPHWREALRRMLRDLKDLPDA